VHWFESQLKMKISEKNPQNFSLNYKSVLHQEGPPTKEEKNIFNWSIRAF
jgi:hypothetical protein